MWQQWNLLCLLVMTADGSIESSQVFYVAVSLNSIFSGTLE